MRQLTYDSVLKVCHDKGYMPIEGVFIVGIRTNFDIADAFNDYLLVMYKEDGQGKMFGGMATTDPAVYWLNNPLNVKGTAIIVPNKYENIWRLGIHKGYTALVQNKTFKVWRDNNKDSVLNRDVTVYDAGPESGINCHRAYEGAIVKTIGKYSAGCQVWQNSKLFDKMIDICKKSNQKAFTYVLFTEDDFL